MFGIKVKPLQSIRDHKLILLYRRLIETYEFLVFAVNLGRKFSSKRVNPSYVSEPNGEVEKMFVANSFSFFLYPHTTLTLV